MALNSEASAAAAADVPSVMNEKPVLWSYFRSSCSWRVRIALYLKGIEFEYRAVHLLKDGGQHHSEAYLAKNPLHLVPALEIDGHCLQESIAIIDYLNETRPDADLYPATALGRAQVRAQVYAIAMDTQPIQNLKVLNMIGAKINDAAKTEWARHWIDNGLKGVEALVAATAGTYCYGDSVTVADICLIPQLFNARRFGVAMEQFPTLLRVEAALKLLPAFLKSEPSAQPDAE